MKQLTYADSDDWLVQVAELLPGLDGGQPQFTLCSAVDEVVAWTQTAPLKSWTRDNRDSLRDDLHAASADCGPRIRAMTTDAVQALSAALDSVISGPGDKRTRVAAVGSAARDAADLVRTAPFRAAAWRDLTSNVQERDPDIHRAERLTALLTAAREAAGHPPGAIANTLTNYLAPSPAAVAHDPDAARPDWSDDRRVTAGERAVVVEPEQRSCVAWLTYLDARLPHFHVAAGDVTFFEAEWCLGNVFGPPHQPVPYADELKSVFRRDHEQYVERPAGAPPVVIVRVDLGVRPPHRALQDAAARVQRLLVTVSLRTGAPAWRRGRFSCLTIDNQRHLVSHHMEQGARSRETDHYGINGYADALADELPQLAGLLATDTVLPGHLTEALRLATEAAQVDSRENTLWRTATIAEQTVVVLQMSAVEHVAALAEQDPNDFKAAVADGYPLARHHNEIAQAVEWGLHGLDGTNPLYTQLVTHHGERRRLHPRVAYEHRVELAAAVWHPRQRRHAARVLDTVGDPKATLRRLEEIQTETDTTRRRLRRARNGLVHGNPTSVEAVKSVRDFSNYILGVALHDAIDAAATNRPVTDLLGRRAATRRGTIDAVRAGTSLYEQWRTRTG